MIRECLDLRQKYLYRENVYPWMKVEVDEIGSSEGKSNPFHFKPVEASAVSHFVQNVCLCASLTSPPSQHLASI